MSIRFAAIGMSHAHIYNQVEMLLAEGAELVSYYGEGEEVEAFAKRYPQATLSSVEAILEDEQIQLIVSAVVPNERGNLGILVMKAGKDYSCAKPVFTSLEELAEVKRVQAETKRIFTVHFGEHFGSPSTVKAAELVQAGAIGEVIQTSGFGPHRLFGQNKRPDWFFDTKNYGGILNDLASHQIEQFLYFTGSTEAEIVHSATANRHYPQFPKFEDFGELLIRSEKASGYIRVDWLSTEGLATWGDVRLFLLGTEGSIEIRKNIDLNGKTGANHLFLVNRHGTEYIACDKLPLPYGKQLIHDVLKRGETAMKQDHCFLSCELALIAQSKASSR
jgi:predicted dehydrogenase